MKKLLSTLAIFFMLTTPVFAGFVQDDGRKTVATGGSAEALTSLNIYVSAVTICAESDNTGVIVVGLTPIAALGTREGVPLNADDCYTILTKMKQNDINLASVLIDTTVNGDGVTFHFWRET